MYLEFTIGVIVSFQSPNRAVPRSNSTADRKFLTYFLPTLITHGRTVLTVGMYLQLDRDRNKGCTNYNPFPTLSNGHHVCDSFNLKQDAHRSFLLRRSEGLAFYTATHLVAYELNYPENCELLEELPNQRQTSNNAVIRYSK